MKDQIRSQAARPAAAGGKQKNRDSGRGGKFFVLDRAIWEKLWAVNTSNRLNLVTAFLVLLAGTGADHRLTKWSAKACEERAGMGKPRAKAAIEELVSGGLVERTTTSTAAFPHYRLAEPKAGNEPIFLPMQLVTGLANEVPLLRRIRETGDAMLLRMLVDMYGLVQPDVTYGIPILNFRKYDDAPDACRKVGEFGANTLWAVSLGTTLQGRGPWRDVHSTRSKSEDPQFWPRIHMLKRLGAFWYEPWIFSGENLDAEPLFPASHASFGKDFPQDADVIALSEVIGDVTEAMVGERTYILDQNADRFVFALPSHHQPPAVRGVARLRVEPDTPGRRLSFKKRRQTIDSRTAAYRELLPSVAAGKYNRPLRSI